MATENETTPQSQTGNNNSGGHLKIKAIGSWIVKNSDAILKLVGSIAIIFGTLLVANYESKMSAIALITQREQAESDLRSNMFSHLIAPVAGSHKDSIEVDSHRERVLVELLALNFHEHFEFKPLMIHVDNRLREKHEDEKSDEKAKEKAKSDRESLQSIARRVTDRQIAMLINEGAYDPVSLEIEVPYEPDSNLFLKDLIKEKIIQPIGENTLIFCDSIKNVGQLQEMLEKSKFCEDQIDTIIDIWKRKQTTPKHDAKNIKPQYRQFVSLNPPDSKGTSILHVMLSEVDWTKKTVTIEFSVTNDKSDVLNEDSQKFTLTLYDFPLTDNTMLPDGNRFALVLSAVDVAGKKPLVGTVTLRIIWFPKGYFTARERPIKHVEFRDKLGI